jgi:hypothetical protein
MMPFRSIPWLIVVDHGCCLLALLDRGTSLVACLVLLAMFLAAFEPWFAWFKVSSHHLNWLIVDHDDGFLLPFPSGNPEAPEDQVISFPLQSP